MNPVNPTKWKDEFYVKVYQLACSGMSEAQISEQLGVQQQTFSLWKKLRPALIDALEQGGTKRAANHERTFREYVYQRLSPEMKEVWDKLNQFEADPNGFVQAQILLEERGKRVRQHLFLYAIVHHNFNTSKACRSLYMSSKTFNEWMTDPDFASLMREIHTHKKDFFEEHLVQKVAEGDTTAVVFANRTLNADRGYNTKTQVEHSGTINHNLLVYSVDDLQLDLEVRKAILHAIREKKAVPVIEHKSDVPSIGKAYIQDAEVVE